jgi:NADH:ubiquinone oxidoreductase subunit 6 (subunit J)
MGKGNTLYYATIIYLDIADMKIIVIAILVGIIFTLFSAMRYMVTDRGKSTRTVKALSLRIGASIVLFAALLVLVKLGYIKPNPSPYQ